MGSQLLLNLSLDSDRRRRPLDPSKPRSRCSLCRTSKDTFRPGCLRCELRRSIYAMDSPEERAAWAATRTHQQRHLDAKRAAEASRLDRLRGLGRPVRAVLVGCGTRKRRSPCRAREMYCGPLTRAALHYAEHSADEFWILSALHGLLSPDRIIEPYDRRLPTRMRERLAWGTHVSARLAGQYGDLAVTVEVLAGADYADALTFPARWVVSFPFERLAIGQRLRWLALRRRDAPPAPAGAAPLTARHS